MARPNLQATTVQFGDRNPEENFPSSQLSHMIIFGRGQGVIGRTGYRPFNCGFYMLEYMERKEL